MTFNYSIDYGHEVSVLIHVTHVKLSENTRTRTTHEKSHGITIVFFLNTFFQHTSPLVLANYICYPEQLVRVMALFLSYH